MSKTIVIDGVKYVKKPEKKVKKVNKLNRTEEQQIEDAADIAAKKILAKIGVGQLQDTIEKLQETIETRKTDPKKAALLGLDDLDKKDLDQLEPKEKIVKFFQAMVQQNHTVLKALI